MPISSTSAPAPTPQAVNAQQLRHGAELAQAQQWKLNQLLTAQVVKLTAGETALRINGQLYLPVTPLPLTPGMTKQLRVASLDPVIKLTLVENGGVKDMPVRLLGPAVAPMNNSLWAASVSAGPYRLATLLSLFRSPPQVLQQHLSPQVQASLSAIATLLPNTEDLRSVNRLKHALASMSLSGQELTTRVANGSGSELGKLLQALHSQLIRQNQEQLARPGSNQLADAYRGEAAMRASVTGALLSLLEDAIGIQGVRSNRAGNAPFLPLMQWNWEFPLLEKNRGRLFSLRAWLKQQRNSKSGALEDIWCLRCACDLFNFGRLAIVLRIKGRGVRTHLVCETSSRLGCILAGEATYRALLEEYGLRLLRFSGTTNGELKQLERNDANKDHATGAADLDFERQSSLTDSMNERLRHAAVNGALPVLTEFELEDGAESGNLPQQLPDSVHQALASLFSVLLDIQAED